jgi:hypothetical protein
MPSMRCATPADIDGLAFRRSRSPAVDDAAMTFGHPSNWKQALLVAQLADDFTCFTCKPIQDVKLP